MARLTQLIIRALESIGSRTGAGKASHLALGERGESEAYFYLKRLGYRFVATNFRVPNAQGEIDLIGWDKKVLCFVEVKTRGDDSFAPPATAVTAAKQSHILSVAQRYLRRLPGESVPGCRFDILSIVPGEGGGPPEFSLRKGAYTWKSHRPRREPHRDNPDRRFWRAGR